MFAPELRNGRPEFAVCAFDFFLPSQCAHMRTPYRPMCTLDCIINSRRIRLSTPAAPSPHPLLCAPIFLHHVSPNPCLCTETPKSGRKKVHALNLNFAQPIYIFWQCRLLMRRRTCYTHAMSMQKAVRFVQYRPFMRRNNGKKLQNMPEIVTRLSPCSLDVSRPLPPPECDGAKNNILRHFLCPLPKPPLPVGMMCM